MAWRVRASDRSCLALLTLLSERYWTALVKWFEMRPCVSFLTMQGSSDVEAERLKSRIRSKSSKYEEIELETGSKKTFWCAIVLRQVPDGIRRRFALHQ
jgi:hypothetical protein